MQRPVVYGWGMRRAHRIDRLAAIALISIAAAACSDRDGDPAQPFGVAQPNVVLISIDSLRADHLGVYGYERGTSPNIDALAAEGVVFENTMSSSSWTLPAHASMLSSLNARVHGLIQDGRQLTDAATLVSEVFQRNGWRTAALVSAPYLSHQFGFDQGFDVYDDETISFANHRRSHSGTTSAELHARALELLDGFDADPFFLFLHYWDVHYDYDPPPPYDTMFDPDYEGDVDARGYERSQTVRHDMDPRDLQHVVALYDGEIALVDAYLGRLFEALKAKGVWDETMVVVTADHGDEFFEHGRKGHRKTLYRETLQVPLIIKFPSARWEGQQVAAISGLVDIAPTMLEVAGLEALPESNGRSLVPELTGDAPPAVYFADLHGRLGAVMSDPLKLISGRQRGNPIEQLFDMRADAAERHDLAAQRTDDAQALGMLLDEWIVASGALAAQIGTGEFEYDADLTRALRSLGYLR